MKENTVNEQARTKDMASYLLAARAKQITRLKEDVAGLEEALQLSRAFIALFALALTEEEVRETVKVLPKTDEAPKLFVTGRALSNALRFWESEACRHDDGYLITFRKISDEA